MNSFQNWISSLDKKSMAPSFKSSSCIQYGSFSSSRFSGFSSRNAGFAFEKKIQWLRHWILSVLLQWNVHLQLTWTHKCLKNYNSSTAHVAAFVLLKLILTCFWYIYIHYITQISLFTGTRVLTQIKPVKNKHLKALALYTNVIGIILVHWLPNVT